MTDIRSSIGSWNKHTFWSLIATSIALGVGLLALNGPFSSIRNLLLVMFVTQVLSLVIAVLVYSRVYPAATVVELLGVAIWGYIGISIAGVFGYFAFAGMSGGYPGPTQEMVNDITRFLVTTAVIGSLYAAAASVRDRPLLTGAVLLLPGKSTILGYRNQMNSYRVHYQMSHFFPPLVAVDYNGSFSQKRD